MSMIQNPVLKGFNPDPSMLRVGDDFYIAVSTFEWFPGVVIYHSTDMKNWRQVARPLNRVELLDMKGNPDSGGVWAPQLSYADGKFYLIFSDVKVTSGSWKDVTNYLTTCDTIDGEWSSPVYMNQSGFDPSLFHDEDGRKWFVNMIWDHRNGKHDFGGIVLQEYDADQEKLIGDRKIIYTGTDVGLTEAPHLYKINEYYYLLTAEGGTMYDHHATIARSKTIDGPYETHPDNPLISSWGHPRLALQKAGHGSLVETQNGEWYLAHLTARPTKAPGDVLLMDRGYSQLGRETAIQKLEWKEGWPYVVDGNYPKVSVEAPDLPEQKWDADFPIVDQFDSEELGGQWQTLRIPYTQFASLSDNPGNLRLYGAASFSNLFKQALVARRWQAFEFEAETKVTVDPVSFQQQAGLVNYYNTKNWTSVHVTWHEDKGKVIDLYASERDNVSNPLGSDVIPVPEDAKSVWFKVNVDQYTYQYSYSFDGEKWEDIPAVFDSWKLSDEYIQESGFFTGAFVGMSCIDTSGMRLAADFEYFRYEEKEDDRDHWTQTRHFGNGSKGKSKSVVGQSGTTR